MIEHPHVHVEAGVPLVAGSRVPVSRLWHWYRGGTAIAVLFKRYPQLGPAAILDALSFAYDNTELIGVES